MVPVRDRWSLMRASAASPTARHIESTFLVVVESGLSAIALCMSHAHTWTARIRVGVRMSHRSCWNQAMIVHDTQVWGLIVATPCGSTHPPHTKKAPGSSVRCRIRFKCIHIRSEHGQYVATYVQTRPFHTNYEPDRSSSLHRRPYVPGTLSCNALPPISKAPNTRRARLES